MKTIYLSKNMADFPREISDKILSVVETVKEIDDSMNDYFLYGSYIRSLWTNEKYGDIDIAFRLHKDEQNFKKRYGDSATLKSGKKMNFHLAGQYYNTPEIMLDGMDLAITQILYYHSDHKIYYRDNYFELLSNRAIVLNKNILKSPLQTICRTYKYMDKGFYLPVGELYKILLNIKPRHPFISPFMIINRKKLKSRTVVSW